MFFLLAFSLKSSSSFALLWWWFRTTAKLESLTPSGVWNYVARQTDIDLIHSLRWDSALLLAWRNSKLTLNKKKNHRSLNTNHHLYSGVTMVCSLSYPNPHTLWLPPMMIIFRIIYAGNYRPRPSGCWRYKMALSDSNYPSCSRFHQIYYCTIASANLSNWTDHLVDPLIWKNN